MSAPDPAPIDPGAPSPPKAKRTRNTQPRKTSLPIAKLALRLYQVDKLTYDEIAERLAISRMSVTRMLQMARAVETDPIPEEITVPRSAQAPLQFSGTLKTKASSEFINTKPETPNEHYWEIAVYSLANDPARYVVSTAYHKRLKGQVYDVYTADVTTDVPQALAKYDPLAILAGFPPVERFAVMQQSLQKHCQRQYESLVTTILAEFPVRLDAPAPAVSSALHELSEAARPFVGLQTPESARLAAAVRALLTAQNPPDRDA